MFIDSDTFINTWSTETTKSLFKRFDQVSYKSTRVVIGGEPSCYSGKHCSVEQFEAFYPEVKNATSCAAFVNSGCYMGRLPQIWKMVLDWTIMDKVKPPAFDTLIGSSKDDDQGRAMVWYGNHRDEVVLDQSGKIFRNLMFGWITHRNPDGKFHCGPNTTCGGYHGYFGGRDPTGWTLDSRRKAIAFRQVEDCETEPYPFLIHGNGIARRRFSIYRNLILQNHTFDEFSTFTS